MISNLTRDIVASRQRLAQGLPVGHTPAEVMAKRRARRCCADTDAQMLTVQCKHEHREQQAFNAELGFGVWATVGFHVVALSEPMRSRGHLTHAARKFLCRRPTRLTVDIADYGSGAAIACPVYYLARLGDAGMATHV